MPTVEKAAVKDRARTTREVHLAKKPYTHALCGLPRGDMPLRPKATATCVVCLDLAGRLA